MDAPTRAHRFLLRLLLGSLCAFTLVILVSALHRLALYEEAFGLTRSRLFAEAFALWLGGLFVLVVIAGVVPLVRQQLPRAALAATAAALLAFSFPNLDGLIADMNLERWRDTGRIDLAYLQGLSADAAPALAELPSALRRPALAALAARLAREDRWSSFNVARERARDSIGVR